MKAPETSDAQAGESELSATSRPLADQAWADNALPKISVCCITFNHRRFIAQCIEGFLMQETSFPVEVIIHDDASTDGTQEIIREYAAKHPKLFRPILQTENQYSQGRRVFPIALAAARAGYIAICEGDDYWTDPKKLQKQAAIMDQSPQAAACVHDAQIVFDDRSSESYLSSRNWPREISIERILESWFIMTSSLFFRKAALLPLPHWHAKVKNGDWLMQMILASRGAVIPLREAMSVYRRHAGGVSNLFHQESQRLGVIWLYRNFNAWTDRRYDRLISQLIAHQEYDLAMMYREGKRLGPFFSHAWRSLHRSGMGFSNLGRARNLLLPRKISQALTGAGIKRLLRGGR